MSVTVIDTPYTISWARNQNALTLLCTIGTKKNYAIAARVSVWVNNYNSVSEYQSEVMVLHPDSDNRVRITLDMLAGFSVQPDLPDNGAFSLLTNAVLKYQVQYAEMYGSPIPTIRTWHADIMRYAVCGEIAERYARLNMPDWKSGMERPIVESTTLFWIVGEDTGIEAAIRRSQPVYLYGLWYKGELSSQTLTVTVRVTSPSLTNPIVNTYSVTNGSMYRLDVSPNMLGLNDSCLYYTVSINSTGGSWNRTFRIVPDGYNDQYMLLQNKYGVLLPWVCHELKRELVLDTENVRVGRLHYSDLKDVCEKYTAFLPMLTYNEAKQLARCLGQRYHYIKSGFAWLRIVVEPESYVVREETENMVKVSFAFRFVENQQENMSDAPRMAGMSFNFDDDVAREYVAWSDRTTPITNELL